MVQKLNGLDHDDKSNFMYDEAISFDYREIWSINKSPVIKMMVMRKQFSNIDYENS